ncbi:MAG: PopZ family protein [Pseudolabrys sp.]
MAQPAKAQEPSMEEILASIRRIIADDDANKVSEPSEPVAPVPPSPTASAPARPASPPPPRPPAPPAPPGAMNQGDVDAMLADLDGPPKPAPAPADILDLTEAQTTPAPSPNFKTIDGASDVVSADRAPDKPAEPMVRVVDEARRQFAQSSPDRLLSSSAAAAVDNAFNSLAHTVLGNNARTLDDLVKEMLRPMLKSWLDDNLPGLVERIVRAEIERVSRGRS